jgi:hypothetical protein
MASITEHIAAIMTARGVNRYAQQPQTVKLIGNGGVKEHRIDGTGIYVVSGVYAVDTDGQTSAKMVSSKGGMIDIDNAAIALSDPAQYPLLEGGVKFIWRDSQPTETLFISIIEIFPCK